MHNDLHSSHHLRFCHNFWKSNRSQEGIRRCWSVLCMLNLDSVSRIQPRNHVWRIVIQGIKSSFCCHAFLHIIFSLHCLHTQVSTNYSLDGLNKRRMLAIHHTIFKIYESQWFPKYSCALSCLDSLNSYPYECLLEAASVSSLLALYIYIYIVVQGHPNGLPSCVWL